MKHLLLLISVLFISLFSIGQTTAQNRAAALGKGMNFSLWLEDEYSFYLSSTTLNYPQVGRFTESDVATFKSLGFQSIRLPVLFEGFVPEPPTAPYNFNLSNPNVVAGLNYVDSMILWCKENKMVLVIDNHIADDQGDAQQTYYGITNSNYVQQAALIASVWKQAIKRFEYSNPDSVIFEIRNEPNVVSDADLKILYQTVIDTIRKYDVTHTLVVGNSGYYDPYELAASTPYSDTNIIYTTHVYSGDNSSYPGFCFQGNDGVAATDTTAGQRTALITFGLTGPADSDAVEITKEINTAGTWGTGNNRAVWLSEFGSTTLPDVYHDDTSRCNYFKTVSAAVQKNNMPWAYWNGWGPEGLYTSYDGGTTLNYFFSIFDATNILSASHMNSCFATDFQVGNGVPSLGAKITVSDVNCYGESNGQIIVTAYGGVPPYQFSIGGGNFQASDTFSELTAGIYKVKVEDSNGSTSTTIDTVGQPEPLTLSLSGIPPGADSLGSITAYVAGGTPAYSYLWNTGYTGPGITGLSAGAYGVTVTDEHGCTISGTDTLRNQSGCIPVTSSRYETICSGQSYEGYTATGTYVDTLIAANGCDSIVTLNLTVFPTYSTSGSATICPGSSYNFLGKTLTQPGTYVDTLVSKYGCDSVVSLTLSVIATTATITASGPTTFCAGSEVTLTVNPGADYKYKWSNGATTDAITVTAKGTYKVTVTNTIGCPTTAASQKITVNALPKATIKATGDTKTFCTGDDIKLTASGSGDTYHWSTGSNAKDITTTVAGSYSVTVTNKDKCSASAKEVITVNCPGEPAGDDRTASGNEGDNNASITAGIASTLASSVFDVSVYPNPSSGEFHLKVITSSDDNINVLVFDMLGRMLDERTGITKGADVQIGSSYAAGVYLVQVTQGSSLKQLKVVKVE